MATKLDDIQFSSDDGIATPFASSTHRGQGAPRFDDSALSPLPRPAGNQERKESSYAASPSPVTQADLAADIGGTNASRSFDFSGEDFSLPAISARSLTPPSPLVGAAVTRPAASPPLSLPSKTTEAVSFGDDDGWAAPAFVVGQTPASVPNPAAAAAVDPKAASSAVAKKPTIHDPQGIFPLMEGSVIRPPGSPASPTVAKSDANKSATNPGIPLPALAPSAAPSAPVAPMGLGGISLSTSDNSVASTSASESVAPPAPAKGQAATVQPTNVENVESPMPPALASVSRISDVSIAESIAESIPSDHGETSADMSVAKDQPHDAQAASSTHLVTGVKEAEVAATPPHAVEPQREWTRPQWRMPGMPDPALETPPDPPSQPAVAAPPAEPENPTKATAPQPEKETPVQRPLPETRPPEAKPPPAAQQPPAATNVLPQAVSKAPSQVPRVLPDPPPQATAAAPQSQPGDPDPSQAAPNPPPQPVRHGPVDRMSASPPTRARRAPPAARTPPRETQSPRLETPPQTPASGAAETAPGASGGHAVAVGAGGLPLPTRHVGASNPVEPQTPALRRAVRGAATPSPRRTFVFTKPSPKDVPRPLAPRPKGKPSPSPKKRARDKLVSHDGPLASAAPGKENAPLDAPVANDKAATAEGGAGKDAAPPASGDERHAAGSGGPGHARAARKLNEEFVKDIAAVRELMGSMDRVMAIRVARWVARLEEEPGVVPEWMRNRNAHASLLLAMVKRGEFRQPFHVLPPATPLPTLQPHLWAWLRKAPKKSVKTPREDLRPRAAPVAGVPRPEPTISVPVALTKVVATAVHAPRPQPQSARPRSAQRARGPPRAAAVASPRPSTRPAPANDARRKPALEITAWEKTHGARGDAPAKAREARNTTNAATAPIPAPAAAVPAAPPVPAAPVAPAHAGPGGLPDAVLEQMEPTPESKNGGPQSAEKETVSLPAGLMAYFSERMGIK